MKLVPIGDIENTLVRRTICVVFGPILLALSVLAGGIVGAWGYFADMFISLQMAWHGPR